MSEKNITALIGKAIREGKYLKIKYENKDGAKTWFWISILDINAKGELYVNMFNINKDKPLRNRKIFISKILRAEILRFSHYNVSEELIIRLDEDSSLEKYEFYKFDNNVLNYFLECYKANSDPFLLKKYLIQELEIKELIEKNPYQLSDVQYEQILKKIYNKKSKSEDKEEKEFSRFHNYKLAICEFSIDLQSRGKFVIAYRTLTFDPVEKTLQIGSKLHFNTNFYIENIKHSLSYYTDMIPADFEALYH